MGRLGGLKGWWWWTEAGEEGNHGSHGVAILPQTGRAAPDILAAAALKLRPESGAPAGVVAIYIATVGRAW